MHNRSYRIRILASVAILIAVAFALSWIEMIISIPMVIPGIKLGLANLSILIALYYCGSLAAFFVLAGRLILCSVLFGNISSLIISAAGAILSFLVMLICKRLFGKHIVYVSICGGVSHNIGQLIAASFLVRTSYMWLVPYLIIGGISAGAFIGFACDRILKYTVFRTKDTSPKNSKEASSGPASTDDETDKQLTDS